MSVREAFWLAMLLHLILLFLPQSFNPFALFWKEKEVVAAEPITMRFRQPEQPEKQTEITDQQEKQRAITPEESQEQPKTDQPTVHGQTNLKALESPPPRQQPSTPPQPREKVERVEETGEEQADEIQKEKEEIKTEQETTRPDPQRLARSQRALEAAENFQNRPISDIPIQYNNPEPSSAEHVDGMIQFDTYNWDYEPYKAKMMRKLYREWVPKLYQIGFFMMGEPGRTVISFQIMRDGSVRALILRDGATIASYDVAARHSIEALYPGLTTEFPPLPPGFPKEYLGVTIGYFVNMDPDENKRQ